MIMDNQILFTVIVPVYKIRENLLRDCLKSLIHQDCKEAEFLIIDDGSPDSCGSICDEYAEQDPRIQVFHTENKGVSHARNVGIKNARGKYITFLDGDDCLEEGVCSNCISKMEESKLELIEFMFCSGRNDYSNFENLGELVALDSIQFKRFRKNVISHIEEYEGFLSGSSCGKVYLADVIKQNCLMFQEGLKKCQDRVFLFDYLSVVEKIGLFYYPGYRYVYYAESITNRYNPNIDKILLQAIDAFELRVIESDNSELLEALYAMCVRFYCVILSLDITNKSNTDSFKEKRKRAKELAENEKFRIPIKECHLNMVGKRNTLITVLLRLRFYSLVVFVASVIL